MAGHDERRGYHHQNAQRQRALEQRRARDSSGRDRAHEERQADGEQPERHVVAPHREFVARLVAAEYTGSISSEFGGIAWLERDEVVYLDRHDLGVAVQTDEGLVVPVVRGVEAATLDELAAEVRRLADGARAGTLKPEELRGSTFTITSAGKLAGLFATPLIKSAAGRLSSVAANSPSELCSGRHDTCSSTRATGWGPTCSTTS